MGWIFQGILTVVASILSGFYTLLMSIYSEFELDIGYNAKAAKTGDYSIFDYSYYSDDSLVTGLLDNTFPGAHEFIPIFMLMAQFIVIITVVIKLVEAIAPDTPDGPGKVIANGAIALIGVSLSYTIFIIMERIANIIYVDGFKATYVDTVMGDSGFTITADYFITLPSQFLKGGLGISELAMLAFTIMIFALLLKQFFTLTLEGLERYVILGILFYTCPLAFAALVSSKTKGIFSAWIQMVLSQFFLMMMNLFFLGVFYGAFCNTFSIGGAVFESAGEFCLTMLLLIGWLYTGQKVDEHLRSLGLSVSQSGHALGTAILGSGQMLRGMIVGAGGLAARNYFKKKSDDKKEAAKQQEQKEIYGSQFGRGVSPTADVAAKRWMNDNTVNGVLTKAGTAAAWKDAIPNGVAITGSNAMKALEHEGITKDTEALKSIKDPNGKMHSQLDNASLDFNNAKLENGKFSIPDKDGNIGVQIGNKEGWTVPAGMAQKDFEVADGVATIAATQDIVDKDVENARAELNATSEKDGITWHPGYTKNAGGEDVYDGTLYGKDKDGKTVQQAVLSNMGEIDANKGRGQAEMRESNGASYYVQDLSSGQDMTPGFKNMKKAADSPELVSRENVGSYVGTGHYDSSGTIKPDEPASFASVSSTTASSAATQTITPAQAAPAPQVHTPEQQPQVNVTVEQASQPININNLEEWNRMLDEQRKNAPSERVEYTAENSEYHKGEFEKNPLSKNIVNTIKGARKTSRKGRKNKE